MTANDVATAEVKLKKCKEDAALSLRQYLSVSTLDNVAAKEASADFIDEILQAVAAQDVLVHTKAILQMGERHGHNTDAVRDANDHS